MSAKSSVILLKNKTVPADPYEEEFEEKGYFSQFIPLLDHVHLDKGDIASYLGSDEFIYETSSFIITSQRAVEVLNESVLMVEDAERKLLILQKPAYTVGPATAKILSHSGFTNVRGGEQAGNGSILSDLILKDELLKGREREVIVFFTGEIRKDIIPRRLLLENFNLVERVVYKTTEKASIVERFYEAVDNCGEAQNWIVFFSPQGTENIVSHIRQNLSNLQKFKIASIGPTTETYLLDNGITPNVVLRKPQASSLVESIQNCSD